MEEKEERPPSPAKIEIEQTPEIAVIETEEKPVVLMTMSMPNSGKAHTEEGGMVDSQHISSIQIVEPTQVKFLKRKGSNSPQRISYSTPDYLKGSKKRRERRERQEKERDVRNFEIKKELKQAI